MLQVYKEYALCRCLEHALPNDSLIKNDPSQVIYNEASYGKIGYGGAKAIDSLAAMAANRRNKPGTTAYEGNAYVYDCMKFFKSPQLDSVEKKTLRNTAFQN